jgi:hypothetical protein
MKNERGPFDQSWEYGELKLEHMWLGVQFWEEEDWIEAKLNLGRQGFVDGFIVGKHKPIGEHDKNWYEFFILERGELCGVHKSRLTKV